MAADEDDPRADPGCSCENRLVDLRVDVDAIEAVARPSPAVFDEDPVRADRSGAGERVATVLRDGSAEERLGPAAGRCSIS